MTGDIFPRGQPGNAGPQQAAKAAHLQRLLPTLLQWVTPPEQAVQRAQQGQEQPLVDACR